MKARSSAQAVKRTHRTSGQHAHRHPLKRRMTVNLPVEVLDRLRNAAYWSSDHTLASLIETAITALLDRLEHEHGSPFPQRLGKLKPGRPRLLRPIQSSDAVSKAILDHLQMEKASALTM